MPLDVDIKAVDVAMKHLGAEDDEETFLRVVSLVRDQIKGMTL